LKLILRNIITVLTVPERRNFAVLVCFNTLVSIADIVLLTLLIYTVNFYTNQPTAINLSWVPAWLQQQQSLLLIAVMFGLFIIKNALAYFVSVKQHRFVYNVAARMSHDSLLRYLSGDYFDYVNTDSSVYIRRIGQQPIEFCIYLLLALQQMITESILIILSVTAILLFNATLFLLLITMLLPPVIIVSLSSRKRLKSARRHVQSSNETALQYLQEAISGYIESCIYERKEYFAGRYAANQHRFNNFLADLQIIQNVPSRLLEVFAVLGLFLLIFVSKMTNSTTLIDVTTIGAFIAAAYKVIPGVVKIFNLNGQMRTYEFTVHDLLKESKESHAPAQKVTMPVSSIVFESVSFYYHEQAFLENFNLEIKAGSITGIAGKSGKGKTTIINLLLGFLSQEKGYILFNGAITNAEERKSLWKNIAYAKQQTFLLYDTVLNNIVLNDKAHSKKRLSMAIEMSGLEDVIAHFPEGMQKLITEKGKNISGGQRQRIAIARALYKDADLLIFDEPFSELDDASMHRIMQHLQQLARTGKMILLISHNEKSLSYCDKIVALNE